MAGEALTQVTPDRANRLVFYTAIVGGKDRLIEPDQLTPGAEHVCFTDDRTLRSAFWRVEPLPWPAEDRPRLTARRLKLLPHRLFGPDAVSVWLDATFSPTIDFRYFVGRHLRRSDLAVVRHPWRDCIYEEADECVRLRLDSAERIRAQVARYAAEGFPAHHGLAATGVLLRRHTPEIAAFCEAWWSEVAGGSLRDQLSFDYLRWKLRLPVEWIDVDYYQNLFWRHVQHRHFQ